MTKHIDYHIDWVATFLHKFPHIDFEFQETNSTFDPDSDYYKQGIIFLAALPIACCLLFVLLTLCCLCVNCCCKQRPKKKKGTTCIRFIMALFIIFAIGSIAVGYFGNEEGNKGIQSSVAAIQDATQTLSDTLDTLTTLDHLTSSITQAGVDALKYVFTKYLTNVVVRNEVLKLADEIKSKSVHIKGDIDYIKLNVENISLNHLLDVTQDVEFYRWVGTTVLLSWQFLVLLIYVIATLKKSKYWLVWGISLGLFSLMLVWVAAGAYLGGTVAISDFCVDPNAFVVSKLKSKVAPDVIYSYIECKTNNFSQALDDALNYVTKANDTLNTAVKKTKPYHISQFVDGPVKAIWQDLSYAHGNITSLGGTVYCGQIHRKYVQALNGLCNRSLVGMSLVLLILPILGLCLVFIQCIAPGIWLLLYTRKNYRKVDDSDPFLPHPPPYNSYGTMGNGRAPMNEPNYLEENTVMTSHPYTESIGSESPPPAYHRISSYSEQVHDLGTFPTRNSGINHYATTNI